MTGQANTGASLRNLGLDRLPVVNRRVGVALKPSEGWMEQAAPLQLSPETIAKLDSSAGGPKQ